MAKYDLDDPGLQYMGRIIGAGVRHALKQPPRGRARRRSRLAIRSTTLDQLGFGMGVHDDDDNLAASMALFYDALYAYCELADASRRGQVRATRMPEERISFLRAASGKR